MEDWPQTAHTCRERLLAENKALREELLGRERPNRYAPDYSPIEGTNAFIQWKGTEVCCDFRCECGAEGHIDAMFVYAVACPKCGKTWQMPHSVSLIEQNADDARWHEGFALVVDDDNAAVFSPKDGE